MSSIDVDVWCIEDVMPKDVSGSNSEEKYKVLPLLIRKQAPDFVMSISTAESTPNIQGDGNKSINGSVLFGRNYAMFDVHSMEQYDPDSNSGSNLPVLPFAESIVKSDLFNIINSRVSEKAKPKLRKQVHGPADMVLCEGNEKFVSIGVVNVTDYKAYPVADKAAYAGFTDGFPVCIETTHGVVNMSVRSAFPTNTPPVLFVSPITDRYLHFNDDVGTDGLQNYIAGFNAGVAVGELLLELDNNPAIIVAEGRKIEN